MNKILRALKDKTISHPNKEVILSQVKTYTLSEIETLTNKLASYIVQEFDQQEHVPVYSTNDIKYILGMISIWKAGKIYVPFNSDTPNERIKDITVRLNASKVLTDIESFANIHNDAVNYDLQVIEGFADIDLSLPANKTSYVLTTSGTTGTPKLVEVSDENLNWLLETMNTLIPFKDDDTFLISTPPSFDVCFHEMLSWIYGDGKVLLINGASPLDKFKKLPKYLLNQEVTHLALSPSVCKSIYNIIGENKENITLKYLLLAGEELPASLAKSLLSLEDLNIFNLYGPTETTIYATYKKVNEAVSSKVPIGQALPGAQVVLIDQNNEITNEYGEIYIAGDGVSLGYLNDHKLSDEKFKTIHGTRFYKTGDYGYYDGKDIIFDGRIDSQVKINGIRVELNEIDNTISRLIGSNKNKTIYYKKQIISFIVDDVQMNEKKLEQKIASLLPYYMVPSKIISIKELPLTLNRKVDEKKLINIYENSLESTQEDLKTPLNADEEYLKIFTDVVNQEVDYHDNLLNKFHIDSLDQVAITIGLEEYFNIEIDSNLLLNYRTPKDLYAYLTNNKKNEINDDKESTRTEVLPYIKDNITANTYNLLNREAVLQETYYIQKCYYHDHFDQVLYDKILLPDSYKLSDIEKAINKVISDNELLRSYLAMVENQLFFKCADSFNFQLREYECSFDEAARDEVINYIKELKLQILSYFLVISDNRNSYLHVFINHHICDQASLNLLLVKISNELQGVKNISNPDRNYFEFIKYQNRSIETQEETLSRIFDFGFDLVTQENLKPSHKEIQYIELDYKGNGTNESVAYLNYVIMQAIMAGQQLDVISGGSLVDLREFTDFDASNLIGDIHTTIPLISYSGESYSKYYERFAYLYKLAEEGVNINNILYYNYPSVKQEHKEYELFIDDNQKVSSNYLGGIKCNDIQNFVRELKEKNIVLKTFSLTKHYVTCFQTDKKLIIVPLNGVQICEETIKAFNGSVYYED
ncbi:non-ribosomal peptide synthetase [Bacillus salacetis]|uniref:non-ribosomal peptide synthetase n=1 Tax=Bacillus salacetis TaxID=2315464 RepID=UPI003BA2CBC3